VALARPRLRADDLGQERLGGRIAVQDAVLAALFVIDDELHAHARIARPPRVRRISPVADEITGIPIPGHQCLS